MGSGILSPQRPPVKEQLDGIKVAGEWTGWYERYHRSQRSNGMKASMNPGFWKSSSNPAQAAAHCVVLVDTHLLCTSASN